MIHAEGLFAFLNRFSPDFSEVEFRGLEPAIFKAMAFHDERAMERLAIVGRMKTREWLAGRDVDEGSRSLHWIFHLAFGGSTLLSRILGQLPGVASIREPTVLTQLALAGHFRNRPDQQALVDRLRDRCFRFFRDFDAAAKAVVIKPHDVVNYWINDALKWPSQAVADDVPRAIAPHLAIDLDRQESTVHGGIGFQPVYSFSTGWKPVLHELQDSGGGLMSVFDANGFESWPPAARAVGTGRGRQSRGLVLLIPFRAFLASVLKESQRRIWIRTRLSSCGLDSQPSGQGKTFELRPFERLTDAEAAAVVWCGFAMQLSKVEMAMRPCLRVIELEAIQRRLPETVQQVIEFLELPASADEVNSAIERMAGMHSKSNRPFDPDEAERKNQAVADRYADEFRTAERYLKELSKIEKIPRAYIESGGMDISGLGLLGIDVLESDDAKTTVLY